MKHYGFRDEAKLGGFVIDREGQIRDLRIMTCEVEALAGLLE